MKIDKKKTGTEMTLVPEGWLDTQAAPELKAVLESLDEDVETLVIDCGKIEYISSSGIREIVAAHKKMNGKLTLTNVSMEVRDVFRLTGLDKRLNLV